MKIVFLTKGSWGDVQPVIVLGHALIQKQHQVTVATHARYRGVIEKHGLGFAELPGDPFEMLESKEGQQMLAAGQGTEVVRRLQAALPPSPQAALEACRGAELIVSVTMTQFEAYCAAEYLGVRYVRMCLVPLAATSQSPSVLIPIPNVSRFLNLLTHEIVELIWWSRQKPTINKWRKENNLSPVNNALGMTPLIRMQNIPLLAAFSPSVFPKPYDWGWTDSVCGYMFWSNELSAEEKLILPDGIEDFVANGPAPIYFGFGSMPTTDPDKLLSIAKDVVRTLGCRVVVCAGWTRIKHEESKDLFMCDKVAHDWLFPRCQTLVIHGGVGTTGASLRAGKPIVVCPVFADQPFWGSLVFNLGCGPKPIPFKDLDSVKLTAALKYCQHPTVISKAEAIGKKIQAEWDGGRAAVEWLETIGAGVRPPIQKMATLGTGAVVTWKLQDWKPVFRLLLVFFVLFCWWMYKFR